MDEWDALVKNQTYLEEQIAKRKAEEAKYKKQQYAHELEHMRRVKEDEKVKQVERLKAERQELAYLDREHEEYNKMRKAMDKQAKNQNAIDLLNQVGKDKNLEEAIKYRELDDMQKRIT